MHRSPLPIRVRLIALAVLLALGVQPIVLAVGGVRQYTVKPGDTLGGISASLGVPQQQLIELNQLPDADRLVAGQTLLIPEGGGETPAEPPAPPPVGPAASPAERTEYTVKPGDSISTIAAAFGLPSAAIIQANNLVQPDRIAAGQKLIIPGSRAPAGGGSAPVPARPAVNGEVGTLLGEAAASHKLDPALVKSLAWYLSFWRPDAGSAGGAVGVMQVTASTQEWVSQSLLKRPADRSNLRDNIEIGVAYLAYVVGRLGEERLGVAAYLQGPASVARGGISPTTNRALETIYGSRGRFTAGAEPTAAAVAVPQATPVPRRDLAAGVIALTRNIAPGARVGVAARGLATGEWLDLRSGEVFPSASVNKVAIMIEVNRQLAAGKLARSAGVVADLERMIAVSDNDAANRLLNLAGEHNVNTTMASLGLGNTVMRNPFSARAAELEPGFNQTTPAEAATLMMLLTTDKLVSPAASQEMRALLGRAQDGSKLVRGLPPGTRVAHKSGWYGGVANDVGIVYAPRGTYVLSVFADRVPDDETGNRLIAEISRLVYETWGK